MEPSVEERFEKVAGRLREYVPSRFPGPADEQTIAAAEAELGVIFPHSYRLFLREFAAGDFPFDIFGVDPVTLPEGQSWGYGDVVGATQCEREEVEPRMHHPLIPFRPNGMGDHWCLDTTRMVGGECPVVFWNHENDEDQKPNQTHAAFIDWLEEAAEDEYTQEYFEDPRNFA